jgi:hypothetical protein
MMTHVEIPAVDYVRAKNAAKAVKTRLHDLGNDVCLNHAYEAVAASLGYKTWAVLKSRLDGETQPDAAAHVSALRQDENTAKADLGWFDLALGDYNPVVMVHGPAGRKRDAVIGAFAGNVSKVAKRVRVINFGVPDRELAERLVERHQIPGRQPTKPDGVLFNLDPTAVESSINFLDLPLGETKPSKARRYGIIRFLEKLTELGGYTGAQDFFGNLVDSTYQKFMEREPTRFSEGVVPEIDKWIAVAGFSFPEAGSWIDVAHLLVGQLQFRLARIAWRHACPRLENLMVEMRYYPFVGTYRQHKIDGEAVIDICSRMISRAIRDYPFLRRPTAVDFAAVGELHVVGIDTTTGASQEAVSLLYRLAFDASVIGFDDFDQQTLVVVSGAEAITGKVKWLLESAHQEGGPMVVIAAADGSGLDQFDHLVTSHIVVGCSTRASVKVICDRLKISEAGFETMHERLFGDFDAKRIEGFAVKRKFVNQREGLITVHQRRR